MLPNSALYKFWSHGEFDVVTVDRRDVAGQVRGVVVMGVVLYILYMLYTYVCTHMYVHTCMYIYVHVSSSIQCMCQLVYMFG